MTDHAPDTNTPYDLVIVGGGPAGATAALYAARAELKTVVIDRSLTFGALGITSKIANYPGIKEVMTGAAMLQIMRDHAAMYGAEFVTQQVIGVDLSGEIKQVIASEQAYQGKTVLICTGTMGRKNKVPGEEEFLGRGVSYCATCDAPFFKGQDVAVVGSSDEAIEEAIFLTKFASTVNLLVPGNKLKADPQAVAQAQGNAKMKIHLGKRLKRVLGNGSFEGVVAEDASAGEITYPVKGVFIYLQGNQPITDFLFGALELTPEGYIKTTAGMETSVPGVYACGDITGNQVKQAVVAAGQGCIAALAADKYLNKRKRFAQDYK